MILDPLGPSAQRLENPLEGQSSGISPWLGQSYMDTLILTSLLVFSWEYLRSPAFRICHFLQGIWLIGNDGNKFKLLMCRVEELHGLLEYPLFTGWLFGTFFSTYWE